MFVVNPRSLTNVSDLGFETWDFFGIWCLVFGVFELVASISQKKPKNPLTTYFARCKYKVKTLHGR